MLRARLVVGLLLATTNTGLDNTAAAQAGRIAVAPDAGSTSITCAGGETMQAVAARWASDFQTKLPRYTVVVETGGKLSADGFADLVAARVNCVLMVRELFPAETTEFERTFTHEVGLLRVASGSFAVRGATHAIAVYVNDANPLRQLSFQQLEAIFGAAPRSSQQAQRWNQLGVTGALGGQTLHVYGMTPQRASGNPPGIVNFLQQRILGGGPWRQDLDVQIDQANASALQLIVQQVARDPAGIGYSGFGFAVPGVHPLAIAETNQAAFVKGSPATVRDRTYPLTRSIYIAFDPGAITSASTPLCRFLLYSLTPAAQNGLAADAEHFLPLPAAEIARSEAELSARTHGRCRLER